MKKKEDKISRTVLIGGIFILIMMIFSIAGFAVLSGAPQSTTADNNPKELPFGENFQNPQTGDVYLGAIRNGEEFIFLNFTQYYDNDTKMPILANKIKKQELVSIYVDENFKSKEAIFLIEKALTGIKKPFLRSSIGTCSKNALILTKNKSIIGDCMVFNPIEKEQYLRADILVYNLIK